MKLLAGLAAVTALFASSVLSLSLTPSSQGPSLAPQHYPPPRRGLQSRSLPGITPRSLRRYLGRRYLGRRSIASNFSASTYVRRGFHSSAIVDNWVYIDGGDYAYYADNSDIQINIMPLQSTIAIDLSQGWQNDGSPLHVVETPKPVGCPSLNFGELWYNPVAKVLMMGFAGESPSNQTYPKSLWQLKVDGNGGGIWSDATPDLTDDTYKTLTRPSTGVSMYSNTSALYLGGWMDYQTLPQTNAMNTSQTVPMPGLVEYNFQNNTWTNHSSAPYSPEGFAALGEMVFVPSYGAQGLFVMLGGASDGLQTYATNNTMRGFDNITIYDPASQKWYQQKATGIIPEPRYQFCAVGQQATNNNAFDMYVTQRKGVDERERVNTGLTMSSFIYAGWDGTFGGESVHFDEVFVLTLPAFQWIKVDYAATKPRYGHTCHVVGSRQMLVVGGVDPSQLNSTAAFESKDNTQQGLGILDMSNLVWLPGILTGTTGYVQNTLIAEIYTTSGKWPAAWNNQDLADLMGYNGNGTGSNGEDGTVPVGLIVGAAIGGLCAVGLIIIGAWLLLRLRHQEAPAPRVVPSAPLELMQDMKFYPSGGSPITEEYAPEKSSLHSYGTYSENGQLYRQYSVPQQSQPQRVVELAHPQVAAVELEGSGSRGSSFKSGASSMGRHSKR
ncbi:MAG: hypothetical protein M1838_000988 [Thelocarpon superellum]|nr:MAG: hypothetical protein M1838_000988 [Thelocarpon superellum]